MANDSDDATGPALKGVAGSAPGQSFRVKAKERVDISRDVQGQSRFNEYEVPHFKRVAIVFSGQQMNRCFILEPAIEKSSYSHGPFFIEGTFKIVEKFNDAKLASLAFKEFEPE